MRVVSIGEKGGRDLSDGTLSRRRRDGCTARPFAFARDLPGRAPPRFRTFATVARTGPLGLPGRHGSRTVHDSRRDEENLRGTLFTGRIQEHCEAPRVEPTDSTCLPHESLASKHRALRDNSKWIPVEAARKRPSTHRPRDHATLLSSSGCSRWGGGVSSKISTTFSSASSPTETRPPLIRRPNNSSSANARRIVS